MAEPKPPDDDEPSLHPKRQQKPDAKCPGATRADVRLLLEAAWAQGAWIIKGGNDHFKIYTADERFIVHMPMTPSGYRTIKNKRAQLKRAGIDPNFNKRRK
jgi:hypothetical protein